MKKFSYSMKDSITSAEGSALVRFGRTTVVCGIKAEVTRPSDDEPQSGWVVPNVELPALCSPLIRPGPPTEEAQAMTVRLSDLLNQCVTLENNLKLFCDVI